MYATHYVIILDKILNTKELRLFGVICKLLFLCYFMFLGEPTVTVRIMNHEFNTSLGDPTSSYYQYLTNEVIKEVIIIILHTPFFKRFNCA